MSLRYTGAWLQDGAFNPLVAPPPPSTTYYLYSWGYNSSGELGLGNTTYYSSPKQVGALTDWLDIAAGYAHTLAIKTNGTLWAWGNASGGRLGLGNATNYSSPKQVGALTNWKQVSCGGGNSAAVKTDGTLWTWGLNGSGQLGLGNTTNYSSPKQVGALTGWAFVSIFGGQAYAIKTDGTLWSWGQPAGVGALGLGNNTYYSSPKQVGALTNWATVTGLQYAAAAIKTDGTLWAWGYNNNGQLGTGNNINRSSPVQVGALTNWLRISGGNYQNVAVKTDGTLWSWGQNNYGQLGLGSSGPYIASPNQVGALTNWSVPSSGYNMSSCLKTNGTFWTWGSNFAGQLGQGNTTDRSSPVQVGALTGWGKVVVAKSGYSVFGLLV
jgi:alpha-tubulin suppressor-like RCC1 family protein